MLHNALWLNVAQSGGVPKLLLSRFPAAKLQYSYEAALYNATYMLALINDDGANIPCYPRATYGHSCPCACNTHTGWFSSSKETDEMLLARLEGEVSIRTGPPSHSTTVRIEPPIQPRLSTATSLC